MTFVELQDKDTVINVDEIASMQKAIEGSKDNEDRYLLIFNLTNGTRKWETFLNHDDLILRYEQMLYITKTQKYTLMTAEQHR